MVDDDDNDDGMPAAAPTAESAAPTNESSATTSEPNAATLMQRVQGILGCKLADNFLELSLKAMATLESNDCKMEGSISSDRKAKSPSQRWYSKADTVNPPSEESSGKDDSATEYWI